MRERLYHYCSINILKLILENKTIRFSNLITVYNMEESRTAEDNELSKIYFFLVGQT